MIRRTLIYVRIYIYLDKLIRFTCFLYELRTARNDKGDRRRKSEGRT